MPYIKRNEQGHIDQIHAVKNAETDQWVDADDTELLIFLKGIKATADKTKKVLSSTDNDMIRVVEDLIDLLVTKQVIKFSELPDATQEKINTRKQLRTDMKTLSEVLDDNETIFNE